MGVLKYFQSNCMCFSIMARCNQLLFLLVGLSLVAISIQECADTKDESKCTRYKEEGRCEEGHAKYYKAYRRCQKTCGLCDVCADGKTQEKCEGYKAKGMCEEGHKHYDFVSARCKKTCGIC